MKKVAFEMDFRPNYDPYKFAKVVKEFVICDMHETVYEVLETIKDTKMNGRPKTVVGNRIIRPAQTSRIPLKTETVSPPPRKANSNNGSSHQVGDFRASKLSMADRLREIEDVWSGASLIAEFAQQVPSDWTTLEEQLGIRFIQTATLNRYDVRGYMEFDTPCLIYPRYRSNQKPLKPSGFKRIRRDNSTASGLKKDCLPPPDANGYKYFPGIFGWHLVRPIHRRVVLTTNERDAMAVFESTQELSLALPHIPQGERQKLIDYQVLPYLEDFDTVYIWFPPWHTEVAREYANTLNATRCIIVSDEQRPIDYLQKGQKHTIRKILFRPEVSRRINAKTSTIGPVGATARQPPQPPPPPPAPPAPMVPPPPPSNSHSNSSNNHLKSFDSKFCTSADYREAIRDEFLGQKVRNRGGKPRTLWQRFRVLNDFLSGFRLGELTIISGPTGIGKTTFLCEYAVDLMKQGVRTLFCSFEMSDLNILKWMTVQFAEKPLWKTDRYSIDTWLDRFDRMESGPLMMMNTKEFQGRHPAKIADAIRTESEFSMIEHVIIDNLQFLIGQSGGDGKSAVERSFQQEQFVSLMRRMATERKVHVTIIINPRKEDDAQPSQVGISNKIMHDSDNILLINRKRQADGKFAKFLYIVKNRFGQERVETDRIEMQFLKETYCHRLVDKQPWKRSDYN